MNTTSRETEPLTSPPLKQNQKPERLKAEAPEARQSQATQLKEDRMNEGRIMTRGVPRWRRLLAAPFFYLGIWILGGQVWLEEFNDEPKETKQDKYG